MTKEEQTALAEKNAQRIAELKTFVGKKFVGKDSNVVETITSYDGVKMQMGIAYHTFWVEKPGHRYCAKCSEFLDSHTEIVEPIETAQEIK